MRVLVTGGAGFIGCNAAARMLHRGHEVVVVDNLSRHEAQWANIRWLEAMGGNLEFHRADVRDFPFLLGLFQRKMFDVVIHMAAQTAVTTSTTDPRLDFESNALGTFNVLEATRLTGCDPVLLYASTNKVYGGMEDVTIVDTGPRYAYGDADLAMGVSERRPLDFHSPYGCSKGAADQYVIDYHRIFGLRTVVLRQSCIYGPRQLGTEDQGWLAWFTIASVLGDPVAIYGDGKQVRDVLYVDDLLDLYDRAITMIDRSAGQAFNVGGGPANAISVLDLVHRLEELNARRIPVSFGPWRPGDQRVFVCDIHKAKRILGWEPSVDPGAGIAKLHEWVERNRPLFGPARVQVG